MAKKVLALFPEYNNSKNVLFMMTKKDVEESNNMFNSGITIIAEGDFKRERFIPEGYRFYARGKLTVGKDVYAVFSDNSVKKL